ncbi:MAG: VCBS repeat-containing protein [Planctomycetes bacterium]|nr:VCBS repeat-containing protein [Planctomycetota bacterium]
MRLRRLPLLVVSVAALVLGGAAAFLVLRGETDAYVAGQDVEGLVDTLARKLPDDRPKARFEDVTAASGLAFRHFPFTRTNRLPEDMGSGVALADVDGDGWTDVFLVNVARPMGASESTPPARCAVYRNRGDGTFEDASAAAGLDLAVMGNGAAFLDGDADGDLDLLVTSFDALDYLENDGHGRFHDATERAGLLGLRGFWTGIAVGDYDKDGAIDAYVCGYVRWTDDTGGADRVAKQYGADIPASINPSSFAPEKNLLLRNLGGGRFEERAEAAGVANPTGRSLSASFADLTGDGWPDLYVANDVSDNALFVNHGDGTFTDEAAPAMVADYRGAMGLAVGDFDGDGDLDFGVTHWIGQENALYVNHSKPADAAHPRGWFLFMDEADRFGLGSTTLQTVGWATRFFDFDNDGVLDLFAVNGSTIPDAKDRTELVPQRAQLFWNGGGKRGFYELGKTAGAFFTEPVVGRGGATFDYDQDGDEDLVVVVHGGSARLLRNDGGDAKHSVRVRMRQPSGNTFAIGAKLALTAGGRTRVDELDTQGSYLSQHAVGELAFGLGDAARVEKLAVTWPDGVAEELTDLPVDALVTWTRGAPPVIELLPGKRAAFAKGPAKLEDRKRFYALLDRASRERVAGEFAKAEATYGESLGVWPGHADSLYYRANCKWEQGRVDEALATLDELVRIHPGESRAWMQMGVLALQREGRTPADLDRAERAFARNHALNGEESLPVVRLGVVLFLTGDFARADERFADALVLNAQSVEAAWFRGAVAWRKGDHAGAEQWLAKARELAQKKTVVAQPTLHEGGTKSGAALVSQSPTGADAFLARWKSVMERTSDAAAEYGAP